MKKISLTLLLYITIVSAFAQIDSNVVKPVHPKSYGSLSINYLTNSVYNGRKDSVLTPYITTSLAYYDKSGLFVNGSLSYLSRAGSSRIDLFNLEAGYDFSKDGFDGFQFVATLKAQTGRIIGIDAVSRVLAQFFINPLR